jgi:hypothetical protein
MAREITMGHEISTGYDKHGMDAPGLDGSRGKLRTLQSSRWWRMEHTERLPAWLEDTGRLRSAASHPW